MPIDFNISIKNLHGAINKLAKLPEQMRLETEKTINIFLLDVLKDSKEKSPRVPLDTGALQSSGFVEPCKIDGGRIKATIGYGGVSSTGKNVDYAVIVHDNLGDRIKNFKRPGSGPKFLKTHLDRRRPELNQKIGKALGTAAESLFRR